MLNHHREGVEEVEEGARRSQQVAVCGVHCNALVIAFFLRPCNCLSLVAPCHMLSPMPHPLPASSDPCSGSVCGRPRSPGAARPWSQIRQHCRRLLEASAGAVGGSSSSGSSSSCWSQPSAAAGAADSDAIVCFTPVTIPNATVAASPTGFSNTSVCSFCTVSPHCYLLPGAAVTAMAGGREEETETGPGCFLAQLWAHHALPPTVPDAAHSSRCPQINPWRGRHRS